MGDVEAADGRRRTGRSPSRWARWRPSGGVPPAWPRRRAMAAAGRPGPVPRTRPGPTPPDPGGDRRPCPVRRGVVRVRSRRGPSRRPCPSPASCASRCPSRSSRPGPESETVDAPVTVAVSGIVTLRGAVRTGGMSRVPSARRNPGTVPSVRAASCPTVLPRGSGTRRTCRAPGKGPGCSRHVPVQADDGDSRNRSRERREGHHAAGPDDRGHGAHAGAGRGGHDRRSARAVVAAAVLACAAPVVAAADGRTGPGDRAPRLSGINLAWQQVLPDAGSPIAESSPNVATLDGGGPAVVVGDRAGSVMPSTYPTVGCGGMAGHGWRPGRLHAVGQSRRLGHGLRLRRHRQRRPAPGGRVRGTSATPGRRSGTGRPPTPTATTGCRRHWPSGPSRGSRPSSPRRSARTPTHSMPAPAPSSGLAVLHRRQRVHHAVTGRSVRQRPDRGRPGR